MCCLLYAGNFMYKVFYMDAGYCSPISTQSGSRYDNRVWFCDGDQNSHNDSREERTCADTR